MQNEYENRDMQARKVRLEGRGPGGRRIMGEARVWAWWQKLGLSAEQARQIEAAGEKPKYLQIMREKAAVGGLVPPPWQEREEETAK